MIVIKGTSGATEIVIEKTETDTKMIVGADIEVDTEKETREGVETDGETEMMIGMVTEKGKEDELLKATNDLNTYDSLIPLHLHDNGRDCHSTNTSLSIPGKDSSGLGAS